jgi:hypothetical protein
MSMIYRTVWLGITGALLLGASSPAAAEPPLSDKAGAPVPSAPSGNAANGASPATAPTNPPREDQPSAPRASSGQPYAALAYSHADPSSYRYYVPRPAESSVETVRYWYGWQTLTSLGVSSTFLVLSFPVTSAAGVTLPLALGGAVLGGPIVHWANGNVGKGFISLGMNVGAGALGAVIGAGLWCREGGCRGHVGGWEGLGASMIGAGIGVVVSNIVDASALAYGRRRVRLDETATPTRPAIALLPTLDIQQGRASAGVMGTF